ncbi:MAG: HAD family phosphatase [Cyanobacterium sp. T60_A2020_053]|nr:HAD family phosphatase [Cyanobacterium sp. T60_A2020_053]
MTLKAILFDFNGVIINDESIHKQLIEELLIGENLRLAPSDYDSFCWGRGDYACLKDLLANKGRVVSEEYISKLINQKSTQYCQIINNLESLPLYESVIGFLRQMPEKCLIVGLVSGAPLEEVQLILDRANLSSIFSIIVSAEDKCAGKPSPESYQRALQKLQEKHPDLCLGASNCLVVEDTFPGIKAGQNAQMQVVGITHTYPFHLLHRKADWCADYLGELDLDRISQVMANN